MLHLLIEDMTCGHCERSVRGALAELDPAARVQVNLESKRVSVETTVPVARVVEAIEAIGFTPEPVEVA